MIIYHGSDTPVKSPKILISNRLLDFGEGFYTTSSLEQAQRWAKRVRERKNAKEQIVSIYEFEADKADKDLTIIRFDSPDREWLHFVSACRSGMETSLEYDIVMGPIANDNVYATIQLFETGLLSEAETIIRLKVERIFDQILFHTEKALRYCTYLRHENIEDKTNG
jgi:hypothetical protein